MSGFGFFSLGWAWLGLLILPLVAFYFLKLKRPRVNVPSLVLWQQVLNDHRVNSPFQRFKRNLLLLLQVILLVLIVFGAMQPFWRGRAERVQRIPVLLDCSASMAALKLVWALETDSLRSMPRLSRSMMNRRLSRLPAPRRAISQVKPLRPPRASGSWAHPAGTRKVKAADSSQLIGSATSTRPLEKRWERIGSLT